MGRPKAKTKKGTRGEELLTHVELIPSGEIVEVEYRGKHGVRLVGMISVRWNYDYEKTWRFAKKEKIDATTRR